MKQAVKYEFRKIWTQLTIVGVVALVIISIFLNLTFYMVTTGTITSEGEKIEGLSSFRVLKNESKEMKGVMDQDYLDNLVEKFNASKEKELFEKRLGFDYSKYDVSNHVINFANYGYDTYNNHMGLDYDFLKSENEFYKQYKKSLSGAIRDENKRNWFRYTDEQMNQIDKKIEKINTPFEVDYYLGLDYFTSSYSMHYYLVLIPIAFSLSSLFAKDSNNGIDELTLSSKFGRKKNMNARIMAGNLFTVVVYVIYIAAHLIPIAAVFSLQGWEQSIQNVWHGCLSNISFGTGIFIMILKGLFAALIVANLVMCISITIKYSKVATILALGCIAGLIQLTYTANMLQLQLNPYYYARGTLNFEVYYFIQDIMIPYSALFVILGAVYLLAIRILTVIQYKRYRLN